MDKWRVAFWFGSESEVRYVAQTPEVGDYVSHRSELWLVSKVTEDALGAVVVCEQRAEPVRRSAEAPASASKE
jgi:hypothetical protein